MTTVGILPRAEAQMIEVLGYTLKEFGEAKYLEYRDPISLALKTLEATPTAGKRRVEITLRPGPTTSLVRAERRGTCSSTGSGKS